MVRVIAYTFLGLVLLPACQKKEQTEIDQERIEAYLQDNNLQTDMLDSGLHYIIEEPGTGTEFPSPTSFVKVRYKGHLLDGSVFDETPNTTADSDITEFSLTQVIDGWKQGIPLFKKGGKGILIIPSHLGYKNFAVNGIPANSVLVFEIDLIDFRD